MEFEEDVIDYWVAKKEHYKMKEENFGDAWMQSAIKLQDQNKALIKKIKKFRGKMSISWYENSEGLNTGDWIEKFDNHFKKELNETK